MFIEPMYASPLPNLIKNPKAKPFILVPDFYAAEEKYDGIRLVTQISQERDQLFVDKGITSWSRYGNKRALPEHIMEELAKFPDCTLDGELCAPGKRSYGTMEIANAPDLVYYIFDILQYDGRSIMDSVYINRRDLLLTINEGVHGCLDLNTCPVQVANASPVNTWDEIYALRDAVWARDGEGLILKRRDSIYIPGKRPKLSWIKIKKLQSVLLTVIGWEPSRGLINDRGPYAITRLQDEDGNITTVTTKNNPQCREFEREEKEGRGANPQEQHPSLGRKLWCEFQERTPDNSYRHIRWDHWDE